MNVDLAEQASLPQPGLHFLTNMWDLVDVFPALAQQPIRFLDGGCIPRNFASHRCFFYKQPATGLDKPGDTFEGALGVWELHA